MKVKVCQFQNCSRSLNTPPDPCSQTDRAGGDTQL